MQINSDKCGWQHSHSRECGWRTNAPTYFMAPFARCCLVECRMKIYLADTSHFSDCSPVPLSLPFSLSFSPSLCVLAAAAHCAYVACAASIKRSSLGLALHLVYYVEEERGGWQGGSTGGSSSTFCRNNRVEVFIYCAATVAAAGDTENLPRNIHFNQAN